MPQHDCLRRSASPPGAKSAIAPAESHGKVAVDDTVAPSKDQTACGSGLDSGATIRSTASLGRGAMDGKELVRRIFDEIVNKGRVDAADELMAEDFVDHGPMGDVPGRDGFKQVVGQYLAAMSDLHCEVDNLVMEGDLVGWTVRTTGTHTGDGLGFPATNRSFDTVSANLGRFRNGQAVEHWSEQGMFPMLMQLGVLPPMGG